MLRIGAFSWRAWGIVLCGIVLLAGGSAYFYFSTDPARAVALCKTSNNKPLCYSDVIEKILRSEGIPAAFDALAASYDTDPDFAGTCHAVTHELGDAAYDEFEKTGETELSSKASYCGYGFYHGFMDALYLETNDMEKARLFCAYVGENVPHPPSAEFAEGSCYHGIGHGVTDGTDPRAWGSVMTIVEPGLALCSKVAATNDEWHMRCASGVFNALGNMYLDPKFKLHSDADPYALCRTGPFSPVERKACYNQMNTEAAARGNNNLAAMVGYTNVIQDSGYRLTALQEAVSFYVQVVKNAQKLLTVEDARVCELPTDELKNSCVSGLVGGVMEFGSPGQQYKEALQFCEAEGFPSELRRYCFSAIQANSKEYFTADVIRQICTRVPREYRNAVCQS